MGMNFACLIQSVEGWGEARRRMAHPIIIVVNVEALVRPHMARRLLLPLLRGRTHKPPDWQLIHKELVPAIMTAPIWPGHRTCIETCFLLGVLSSTSEIEMS